MSNKEVIFPDGMSIKAPHENAPDFVKGSISVNKQKFYEWMKTQPQGEWINLDIKVSQKGNMYLSVNTYVAGQSNQPSQPQQAPQQASPFSSSSQQPPQQAQQNSGFDNPSSEEIPF